jgi:tRNA(fMet)-specific endonuclease VapC
LTRYLLDTNMMSDLMRHPDGKVAMCVRTVGEQQVCTSIIVAAELRFGACKKQSARLKSEVEILLGLIDVLPFDAPADAAYGVLRANLEAAGTPISGNDLLIAAQAIALGHSVVTANEREFSRISGLAIENWLR